MYVCVHVYMCMCVRLCVRVCVCVRACIPVDAALQQTGNNEPRHINIGTHEVAHVVALATPYRLACKHVYTSYKYVYMNTYIRP